MFFRSSGSRTAGRSTPPAVAIALTPVAVRIACVGNGEVDTLGAGTELILTADGRTLLADETPGRPRPGDRRVDVRAVLPFVGRPDGARLADGSRVCAEDLVASFVRRLHVTVTDLYVIDPSAPCVVVHPRTWSPSAVDAMRDALDRAGSTARPVAADSADAETAARSAIALPPPIPTAAPSRPVTPRRPPTRVAVAAAATAFAVLSVGGAWATHTSSEPVAPSRTERVIENSGGGAVTETLPDSPEVPASSPEPPAPAPIEPPVEPPPVAPVEPPVTAAPSPVEPVPVAPTRIDTPPPADLPSMPALPLELPDLPDPFSLPTALPGFPGAPAPSPTPGPGSTAPPGTDPSPPTSTSPTPPAVRPTP